ncbi:hypothetical protein SODALDRAFT_362822 [Sodiomyces alkalinus F11]|uniref:Uncharacterized protein n=1 Tax=Sodiomyces alkalinus (strain CBS 110278 / VKM F-3762 / F11) TaxID=1314773 RepID=A0A3N2PNP5_SODAK|nr:hypothetical protein SODALDRAFT_362822 [Sodiomyces alkalinus F11]ROT35966.1 hypothetical protein SODALDRAFT_362822 [Sodiomyces alkalinus F11]
MSFLSDSRLSSCHLNDATKDIEEPNIYTRSNWHKIAHEDPVAQSSPSSNIGLNPQEDIRSRVTQQSDVPVHFSYGHPYSNIAFPIRLCRPPSPVQSNQLPVIPISNRSPHHIYEIRSNSPPSLIRFPMSSCLPAEGRPDL